MFIFPIHTYTRRNSKPQINFLIPKQIDHQPNNQSNKTPIKLQEKTQFILHKNQYIFSFENKLQKKTIIPRNDIIGLHNNINSNENCKKTIVHIFYPYQKGFGDYLRGSILLAQYAKYYNINLILNVSPHPISKYLNTETKSLSHTEKTHVIYWSIYKTESDTRLHSLISQFVRSDENTIYVVTDLFYNINLVTKDIKDYINSLFEFKQEYYNIANKLFNLEEYTVLHIRCKDEEVTHDFQDNYLLTEIIKLQLPINTIIMSNNYPLKKKISKLFGFYFLDTKTQHSAKISDYKNLESTIIDYIILSKSSRTYCFTYYLHGSGFSQQCSVLNNIPYSITFLPNKNISVENPNLLKIQYENLSENNIMANSIKTVKYDENDYNNISFITLTNTGYIDYTLNCLQSLKNVNMKKQLKTYCVGEKGYSTLKTEGVLCELINDNKAETFAKFRKTNWSNIVYYKFEIIYKNLLNHKYVCITDGDIVYENNQMFDYLLNHIEDNDLLIQSEGIHTNAVCSGFMFIKSNTKTLSLFNPVNVEKYRNIEGWGDQIYVNSIKNKIKFKKLPLQLFPTGRYYYEYNKNIQPYMIHFNWVVGHEKKNRMKYYNKWYRING